MGWRREQAGGRKSITLAFLLCAFLLCGCNEKAKAPATVELSAAEKEKAEMLERIGEKFEDADAHYRLGRLYQADGLWYKAEDQYNIALSFDPVHRKAQAARVKVLFGMGKEDDAKIAAVDYIEQASTSAVASLGLALAFQRQVLDDYALTCYRRALRLKPTSAAVNRHLGYFYLLKGDREMARGYLSRSFQMNPDQPRVAAELGRLGVAVRIPKKTESKK